MQKMVQLQGEDKYNLRKGDKIIMVDDVWEAGKKFFTFCTEDSGYKESYEKLNGISTTITAMTHNNSNAETVYGVDECHYIIHPEMIKYVWKYVEDKNTYEDIM